MAGDATPKQIENRRTVLFWTLVIFLGLVIIAIIGGIINTVIPKPRTAADDAAELVEQGNKEREKYPIVEYLPIKNSLFTLGYQFSNAGKKLTLKVTTTETYLDSAINKLTSFGVDLTNCALDITSPASPFLSAYIVNNETDPIAALRAAYSRVESFQIAKIRAVSSSGEDVEGAKNADYILARITTGREDHYNLQTYRVILKKDEASRWIPISNPSPILNIYNTPGIDIELLKLANLL